MALLTLCVWFVLRLHSGYTGIVGADVGPAVVGELRGGYGYVHFMLVEQHFDEYVIRSAAFFVEKRYL